MRSLWYNFKIISKIILCESHIKFCSLYFAIMQCVHCVLMHVACTSWPAFRHLQYRKVGKSVVSFPM